MTDRTRRARIAIAVAYTQTAWQMHAQAQADNDTHSEERCPNCTALGALAELLAPEAELCNAADGDYKLADVRGHVGTGIALLRAAQARLDAQRHTLH